MPALARTMEAVARGTVASPGVKASYCVAALLVTLVWLVTLTQIMPLPSLDRGILQSVAARLLAGDVLYRDVVDNKEPLFFYAAALQARLGPAAEYLFEAALLLACTWSTFMLSRRAADQRASLWLALLGTPLIVVGSAYMAGYTNLPGTVLCLLSVVAAAYGRPALAGAGLALLLFTKIPAFPVGAAACLPYLLLGPRRQALGQAAFGLALVVAGTCAILAIRHELIPYGRTVLENVAYSDNQLLLPSSSPLVLLGHLKRVGLSQLARIGAGCVLLLAMGLAARRVLPRDPRDANLASGALALAAAVLALGLTGLWAHHAQLLAAPALLLLAGMAAPFAAIWPHAPVAASLAVVLLAYVTGGTRETFVYSRAASDGREALRWHAAPTKSTERLLKLGDNGSFARLGSNGFDPAFALGLKGWRLACPRFHQYFFQSEGLFDSLFNCVSKVDTLLVEPDFVASDDPKVHEPLWWFDEVPRDIPWNRFVSRVNGLISSSYVCDADTGLRVCRRKLSSVSPPGRG